MASNARLLAVCAPIARCAICARSSRTERTSPARHARTRSLRAKRATNALAHAHSSIRRARSRKAQALIWQTKQPLYAAEELSSLLVVLAPATASSKASCSSPPPAALLARSHVETHTLPAGAMSPGLSTTAGCCQATKKSQRGPGLQLVPTGAEWHQTSSKPAANERLPSARQTRPPPEARTGSKCGASTSS